MAAGPTERNHRERIARAVNAIVEEPTSNLRLDDLARLAHFSPFHFHRVYAGVVGETTAATIRRVRLALASRLLTNSTESITQVGLAVGYDSPQAFTRAFRAFTGQSPRAFRQLLGRSMPADSAAPTWLTGTAGAPSVRIVDMPEQRLRALRHTGSFATIPHTHRQLRVRVGAGAICEKWGVSFGKRGAAGDFRYYAAIASPDPWPEHADVETLELPAGRYAVHRLVGPYTLINATVQALYARWMPASGYEPDERPMLERYLDTSSRGIAPAALRTDLLIPIRNKSTP